MDNKGREKFWDELKILHDANDENIKRLIECSVWPRQLCRFRTVTENSLKQLNENKMFFSSADYYDDPFDTYFYIDLKKYVPIYNSIRKILDENNQVGLSQLNRLITMIGQNPDDFINQLSNSSLDFSNLQERLIDIRFEIQKKLFSICFCEDAYNETLWLKYASNYAGFVQVYDMYDPSTFVCGTESVCEQCFLVKNKPFIYPVYYSNERYDATQYALSLLLYKSISENSNLSTELMNLINSVLVWEPERISLIKKRCHEYDKEWRMIYPIISDKRPAIKMKPSRVIIGLRTPDYEKRLIVSAAIMAGIKDIHMLYITDADVLDSRPVSTDLFRV